MNESTAEPLDLDDLTLRPSEPRDFEHARRDDADEPRAPLAPPAGVLLAQALVPGLGYLLLRRPRRALLTLALFSLTVLLAYWQFPKDSARSAGAAAQMAVLLALIWANLLYRTARELAATGSGAAGVAAVRQRVERQRQGAIRWLLSLNWLVAAFLLLGINRLAVDTGVDFALFTRQSNLDAARKLAQGLFHPDWSITGMIVGQYAWVSLEMAALGTLGGAAMAAPLSFLAARNLMGRNPATRPIYYVMRFVLSCVRAIPSLIWGLIAVSFTLGHFPGDIALAIFSFGLLAKLFSEAIEAIDWGQIEAVTATGANPVQVIVFAVIPQVIPAFTAHLLYALEVNVHSAVVLGLIGAGGLGLVINEYVESFAWSQASTVLIVTILMTLTIDYSSAYVRSQLS